MEATQRVREYIERSGVEADVVVLEESTRTSELAAKAIGCSVAQIAKSIVFVDEHNTYVVVLSGDRKVDVKKLNRALGLSLRMATPEETYERTGYRVGGVPPFPHRENVKVVVDTSLQRFEQVWAAAGDHNSLMRISPKELVRASGAQILDVSK